VVVVVTVVVIGAWWWWFCVVIDAWWWCGSRFRCCGAMWRYLTTVLSFGRTRKATATAPEATRAEEAKAQAVIEPLGVPLGEPLGALEGQ
jgi:hypothetical protein